MPVNHKIVTLAREARGYSQTALAELVGISQAILSRIENGLREPAGREISEIAKHLRYPISLFMQPDEPLPMPLTFYRKKAQLSKTVQGRIHAQMNFAVMHLDRLARAAAIEPDLEIQPSDPEEFGSAAGVARSLRDFWQVAAGPLTDLVGLIERAGIVVWFADLETPDLQGFSVWKSGAQPMIVVNAKDPADRQRHTLAHELGHIIMHHRVMVQNVDVVEVQADEFASEFLMPEEDIRPHLYGRIDLPRLAALKPIWRVSIASLLKRAGTLRMITRRYEQHLWTEMGRHGYRMREPAELDIPREEPHLLFELFEFHSKHLGYSADEIGSALHFEPDELRRTYFGALGAARAGLQLLA